MWRRFSCLAVGRTKVTVALMLTGKYRMVKFAFREMPVGAGVVMMSIIRVVMMRIGTGLTGC